MDRKQEFPPLLEKGLHPRKWAELCEICRDAFPLSTSRGRLTDGLRRMVDLLDSAGFVGEMWVNGSYLTEKIDPEDIDFAIRLEEAFLLGLDAQQRQLLDWLNSSDLSVRDQIRRDYGCDPYTFCEV